MSTFRAGHEMWNSCRECNAVTLDRTDFFVSNFENYCVAVGRLKSE